jgi:hypothetical protein
MQNTWPKIKPPLRDFAVVPFPWRRRLGPESAGLAGWLGTSDLDPKSSKKSSKKILDSHFEV